MWGRNESLLTSRGYNCLQVSGKRFIGYVRVSTQEQAVSGLGLDAQRSTIAAEARRRGFELVSVCEDAGVSGKTLDRPGLARALELVEAGEADGIIVAKLDRFSRSLLDFAGLTERSRCHGWALVAVDLAIDTSTAKGELMLNVLATFAQFERRLISERTRDALAAARARGIRLGRPPRLRAEAAASAWHMRARRCFTFERIAAEPQPRRRPDRGRSQVGSVRGPLRRTSWPRPRAFSTVDGSDPIGMQLMSALQGVADGRTESLAPIVDHGDSERHGVMQRAATERGTVVDHRPADPERRRRPIRNVVWA